MSKEGARPKRRFTKAIEAFSHDRGVTLGGGKGFASRALKVDGKIFAMMSSKNQFVVKLSRSRVDALVAGGTGKHFEPRLGKFMKEWSSCRMSGWTGPSSLQKRAISLREACRSSNNMSGLDGLNRYQSGSNNPSRRNHK